MSKNRVAIASIVLVALGLLVVWKAKERETEMAAAPDATVTLPTIKQDQIDELTFAAPDRPTVRHVKKDKEWHLVEPIQAKSDQAAISTALGKLGELEVTGVAATLQANHEKLEVDPKKGTRVTAKAGGKVVLDAWVGLYQTGNSMLRKEGEDTVATVKGSIRFAFSKYLREWRDRSIVDVGADGVQSLELSNAKGILRFVKSGDAWAQAPGEKPIANFDPDEVKSLVSTIATLDATDFADDGVTAEAAGVAPGAPSALIKIASDAGSSQVLVRVGKTKDNDYYVAREDVPTIYLVSKWSAERLLSGADGFEKKAEPAAPQGSQEDPMQVAPTAINHPDVQDPEMQRKIQEAIRKAQAAQAR